MAASTTDDLVMESTTDSAEEMAEGLGVSLREAAPEGEVPAQGSDEADAPSETVSEPAVGAADVESDDDAIATVEAEAEPEAPKRQTRKSVNGAAAAARKQASAKQRALAEENERLKAQLAESMKSATAAPRVAERAAIEVPTVEPVKAESIPDTHPEMSVVLKALEDLGPKPKQGDYGDFDEFEEARDKWIEQKARLGARIDYVREDVARRETIALEQASRDFAAIAKTYEQSVVRARGRHEDYDTAMAQATEQGLDLPAELKEALMQSPEGGEVIYHLVTNPDEVDRLNQLPRSRALAELGILEGRVTAHLKRQPHSQQPITAQRQAGRISRAPLPQGTSLGEAPAAHGELSLDDPSLSLAEYNRRRDAMDVLSGRRRPS